MVEDSFALTVTLKVSISASSEGILYSWVWKVLTVYEKLIIDPSLMVTASNSAFPVTVSTSTVISSKIFQIYALPLATGPLLKVTELGYAKLVLLVWTSNFIHALEQVTDLGT